ncbi:MAG TPA: hypothetical protein VN939_22080 [Chthoniobacterales bacterium]|nr:hypothetical protein [Chthoniobacterales bacterium]
MPPETPSEETLLDDTLYHLIDAEIRLAPLRDGLFVLFDRNGTEIEVGCGTLCNELNRAVARFPNATSFFIQRNKDGESTMQMLERVEMLKKEYDLVPRQPIGFAR